MKPGRNINTIRVVGGHIALNLANTVDGRFGGTPHDYLRNPQDVISWLERTRHLTPDELRSAVELMSSKPRKSQKLLEQLRLVREFLIDLLDASIAGRKPPAETMKVIEDLFAEAVHNATILTTSETSLRLVFSEDFFLNLPRLIIFQAIQLLTTQQLALLKCCERGGCGWFYLDNSRKRNRKWCSMQECGNTVKQRRHRKVLQ